MNPYGNDLNVNGKKKLFTYTNNNFDCFVKNGKEIEDPNAAPNKEERYHRIARNGLRNLTYGVPFNDCHLATYENFKALFIKKNPLLFKAARKEMQNIFLNIFSCTATKRSLPDAEKRLEIFINNLLSAYPFMDPEENETVLLPQKINGQWACVRYHFNKIDISPQSGLLSKLIEDEDRIYAYGLEPVDNKDAQPYLLFIGTTYPSGQGAKLNWLYNFKPGHSVGEGHDLTKVEEWLGHHERVKVAGHSKGGTMAMITAAKYPDKISSADCLNPTALCKKTIERLNPTWEKIPTDKKPVINVYAHLSDPIFLVEKNFLEDTHIYRFGDKTDSDSMLAAHVHYFAGRKEATITKVTDLRKELPSLGREVVTDLKETVNWILFPLSYVNLCYETCVRKIKRFCHNHSTFFEIALFSLCIGGCIALATTGVLAPVVTPIIAHVGTLLTATLLASTSVATSAAITYSAGKIANATETVVSKTLFTSTSLFALGSALSIGGIISLIKFGFKCLFFGSPTQWPDATLEKTPADTSNSTELINNSLKDLGNNIQPTPVSETIPHRKTASTLKRSKSDANLLRFSLNQKERNQNEIKHSQSFSHLSKR